MSSGFFIFILLAKIKNYSSLSKLPICTVFLADPPSRITVPDGFNGVLKSLSYDRQHELNERVGEPSPLERLIAP